MRKSVFPLVVLFAAQAHAAAPHCGTDDFGNTVCMDKDGVVNVTPRDRAGGAGSKAAPAMRQSDEAALGRDNARPRCAVDSFGNTVCSQYFKPSQEK